jgi:DNA helicase IV
MKKNRDNEILNNELIEEQGVLDHANTILNSTKKEIVDRLDSSKNIRTTHIQSNDEINAIRDNSIKLYEKLDNIDDKLIFGRIDLSDGQSYHIGKIGVKDKNQNNIVLDWRAKVSGKYYQSRPTDCMGVSRKRSIRVENNKVISISDELFDSFYKESSVLSRDNILLDNILSNKKDKMSSVVNSLQIEQDTIIRDIFDGALIISGAPGTGKTVVALHRAAYLLYTKREYLSKKGVLIIGPSKGFNNYISDVLPSLGEGYARIATISELYDHEIVADYEDERLITIKSKEEIAILLKNIVVNEIIIPNNDLVIDFIDTKITLSKDIVKRIIRRNINTMSNYNEGRVETLLELMNIIADLLIEIRGEDPEDKSIKLETISEIRASKNARRSLNSLWMPKKPIEIVMKSLGDYEKLCIAGEGLFTKSELVALGRNVDNWSNLKLSRFDIPILDEIKEILGDLPYNYATSYSYNDVDNSYEYEINNDELYSNNGWRYGHIIVDEAQNISQMEWRMLLRRVSNNSFTICGDDNQKITTASTMKLSNLNKYFTKMKEYKLLINYRTPEEILSYAESELEKAGIVRTDLIKSIRSEPESLKYIKNDLLLDNNLGSLVVITNDPDKYKDKYYCLTPIESQGREFDTVILDYNSVKNDGVNAIYVAASRANKRLYILE